MSEKDGYVVDKDPKVQKKLEWWQDIKFGFISHWGVNSQWGCVESWLLVDEKMEWLLNCRKNTPQWVERGGDLARFSRDYWDLNKTFNPRQFDPREWVDAAQAAGMKYFVFTTKHHDGFCMYDTKQTDYKITDPSCPFYDQPKADVTKELFKAFRKQGFGVGAYFSKHDWHCEDYWMPDQPRPNSTVNYDIKKYPEKYANFWKFTKNQIEELMSDYGSVDILWLDGGGLLPAVDKNMGLPGIVKMARKKQPGIIVVNRACGGPYENYKTPEHKIPEGILPYPWETCMTLGNGWGHRTDDRFKPAKKMIHTLVDIVSKGGNLLLGFGPNGEGALPKQAISRLREIGEWLKVNGEGIYKTRAWTDFKEGDDIRFTRSKDRRYLYVTCLEWPGKKLTLKTVKAKKGAKIKMLGVKKELKWSQDDGSLVIEIPGALQKPEARPCKHAWVFKVPV